MTASPSPRAEPALMRAEHHLRGNMLRAAIAEMIGTFLLTLVGTAVATAAILGAETAGPAYDSLAITLAVGLVLSSLVGAPGQTSGCQVNPAATPQPAPVADDLAADPDRRPTATGRACSPGRAR